MTRKQIILRIRTSNLGMAKSQVETLVEKLHIIEGFSTHGSVDPESLTNFP